VNLIFSSKVQKRSREAVENLFFMNPRQYRVRAGIVDALEKFGHPRLEEKDDSVYLRVGNQDAQTLFAFDHSQPGGDPIGVVVYLRNSPSEIVIVHLAVHPDYALQGSHAGLGLGLDLIEKVKEIASRIVGVEQIVLHYRQGIVIRLPRLKK
jgi:ribosomal protein S18 acetylase RimI-like enzyme